MTRTYYGTKCITGAAMTRAAYNEYRGWQLPADEIGADEGYLVEYQDGGSASVLPCITMKTATGEILMGWLASQTDMLADDWTIVP